MLKRRHVIGGAFVSVVLAIVIGVSGAVDNWIPSLSFGPTITESNTVPLLIAIRNISDYHGSTGTFTTLAERDIDNWGPDILSGEHITVYAVGTVDSVVDFGQITADNVEIGSDRRTVKITLPAPKLTPVQLDPLETRVVNNDRGIVERINDAWSDVPDNHRDVLVQASGQINLAAERSDLVQRGEQSTRDMLTGLCNSLGYPDVTIEFDPPILPKG